MAIGRALGRAATFWRRSIQARVVVSTLVLAAVVTGVVGLSLMQQITSGIVEDKVSASVDQAMRETADAQARLDAADGTDVDANTQLSQLISTIVARGSAQGYDVMLTGPVFDSGSPAAEVRKSPGLDEDTIPADLVDRLQSAENPASAWAYSRARYDAATDRDSTPAVVAGSQLALPSRGATYALYFVFPMDDELATIQLIRRALVTSGALLLVLVGGVTWLVTRQVVTPVRLARRVAERLSAGRLEERMHVRGDDDIARLASSFNHMAANLQRQIRRLEEMSSTQRRFVADVSHELRTPLTTVRMAGDVLHDARADFDPATARAAELLQMELDRFESLLADLLEISRFDAGAAVLDLDDANIVDIARRVADVLMPLAAKKGITIRIEAPDRLCMAEVDARRIERIVRNLITNAIDYSDSDVIIVSVNANETATALAVRDYGIGLSPGEDVRVFNRFWRADPARARLTGGTGLGLSISLEDAQLHGGWLHAWGHPGAGAQFRLTLPRRAGDSFAESPIPLVPSDAGAVARGGTR
jgi:two-component system sensor histidine kinase MtrB